MEKGFILINCDIGAEEYVIEELKLLPQVKSAYVTFGAYDVIAELQTPTSEEFDRAVSHKIRNISRVESTMTLKVTTPS
ncbi:MAG: Lrp/AsnC ligand binding domain-containing protein [Thaumarchaeota archaeon]|nr:Lrp/AsnC ligand binding domain-containing protein [Nitrososphaerota archaeon]MDE1867596.1 Lrp/AsnC ligand binding domain-containing protein [Nitrososphaerota archaeon]